MKILNKYFLLQLFLLLTISLSFTTILLGCGSSGRLQISYFKRGLETTGFTPLMEASRDGSLKRANTFIQRGENVESKEEKELRTPLHYAAMRGHTKVAELLIKNGATIDPMTDALYTPLHYAAMRGHIQTAELLVKHGANVNANDGYYKKPLYYASFRGHRKTGQFLLESGAEIQVKIGSGEETLATATSYLTAAKHLQRRRKLEPALKHFESAQKYFDMASSQFNSESRKIFFKQGLIFAGGIVSIVAVSYTEVYLDVRLSPQGQEEFDNFLNYLSIKTSDLGSVKELFAELSKASKKKADEVAKVLKCYKSHEVNKKEIDKCL